MGVFPSRVRLCERPDWFPEACFYDHFRKSARNVRESRKTVGSEMQRNVARLPFVESCRVNRTWCDPEVIGNTKVLWNGVIGNGPSCGLMAMFAGSPTMIEVAGKLAMNGRHDIAVGALRSLTSFPDYTVTGVFPRVGFRARCGMDGTQVESVGCAGRFVPASGVFETAVLSERVFGEDPYGKFAVEFKNRWGGSRLGHHEMVTEVGIVRVRPMIKSRVLASAAYGMYRMMWAAGTVLAPPPLPVRERFHVGAPPLLRGIAGRGLAEHIDGRSVGCDHFIAGSAKRIFPVDERVAMHLFVNGGVSAVMRAPCTTLGVHRPISAVACGFGLTVNVLGRSVEANFTLPVYVSDGVPFRFFDVGIDNSNSNGSSP